MSDLKVKVVRMDVSGRPFVDVEQHLDAKSAMERVVNHCNGRYELGHPETLYAILEATGNMGGPTREVKYVEIKVHFIRHIDLDEIVNDEVLEDFMIPWIETFDFDEDEPDIPEGMSFVHLHVCDRSFGGNRVDGRVTACVTKQDGRFRISFAFCRYKDHFTRRRGRRISMEKMEKGEFITVTDYGAPSRYDMVENIVKDYIMKGRSVNHEEVGFPEWLLPRKRVDLDENSEALIRKIATGAKLTDSDVSDAKYILGMDNLERVCVVDREELENDRNVLDVH